MQRSPMDTRHDKTCQVCDKVVIELGLRVVRFRNEEVMKNLSAVVGKIRELVIN